MKKTITAHICGIVFTFEEEAYELLENYLSAVRLQLGETADVEEILTDIESRIAELCKEQLTEINKVITVSIIEKITEQLGDPSVFGEDDATAFEETEKKLKKRFFRHPSDKMLGGVCGGIAAYTNIDPMWIRIFFIIAVISFGFGVPLYLILWIAIPEARTTAEKLQMQGEDINIKTRLLMKKKT
jgi:phage shock protein PspC (stress-responsive transcriptional regulator)